MTMERKGFALELKLAKGDTGTFTGYGAVFGNVDSHGDVIQAGAFTESLAEWKGRGKLPKMLLMHGGGSFLGGGAEDMIPVGKYLSMEEDSRGLLVEGKIFLGGARGASIYEAVKEGELDGLSIGYRVKKNGAVYGRQPGEPERTLTNVSLMEVSLVTFGSNPEALIDGVKSEDILSALDAAKSLSELETVLREAGPISRKFATAYTSAVKRVCQREADAEAPLNDLLASIRATRQAIS